MSSPSILKLMEETIHLKQQCHPPQPCHDIQLPPPPPPPLRQYEDQTSSIDNHFIPLSGIQSIRFPSQ